MEKVFKILKQLEDTSSRNAKKEILKQNEDNELLKKYFLYAYDNRKVFGIGAKSIKINKNQTAAPTSKGLHQNSLFGATTSRISGYSNVFDLLDELVKHPFGSGSDVNAVNNFLSMQDEIAQDWYKRLILKDLKIGCTESTINEMYGDYIPVYEVMLAHPYKKYVNKITGMFQLQEKIDGFRLITYRYPDGTLRFFTRNGLELFDFPELTESFKYLPMEAEPTVYDGECQANDSFNDTQKLIMRGGPKTGVKYNVFDRLPLEEFERKESTDKLFTRYDNLCYVFDIAKAHHNIQTEDIYNIHLVKELYRGCDLTKITEWFEYAKTQGWEGIMIKLNAHYVRKRTADMLKVKEFDTLDLKVIRVNEHKNGEKLGSVTVDYKGNEVDVGSGFDDYSRHTFWENPNLIIDKTIEVQYFEETTNEAGIPSLRFPVFLRVREDK